MTKPKQHQRRATILLMVVGLLAMLFIIVSAFITLARFDRLTLVQTEKRDQIDRVVESVTKTVLGGLTDQLSDGNGRILYPGPGNPDYMPATIPGYHGARIIAAPTIVRNTTLPLGVPLSMAAATDFRFPGISQMNPVLDNTVTAESIGSFSYRNPLPRTLEFIRYTFDTNIPQETPGILVDRNGVTGPNPTTLTRGLDLIDLVDYAYSPFMDADGDGVPDTYLPAMASVIEQANAQVGTAVRVPNSLEFVTAGYDHASQVNNPYRLFDTDLNNAIARNVNIQQFREYDRDAQLDVAVKVIAHGGMVFPDPDTIFGQMMYNWIRFRGRNPDPAMNPTTTGLRDLWRNAIASSESVEANLRRRAGMPSYVPETANEQNDPTTAGSTPSIMRQLETTFAGSLRPSFGRVQGSNRQEWQRFNIADQGYYDLAQWQWAQFPATGAWNAARNSLVVAGRTVDNIMNSPTVSPYLSLVNRRNFLTTVSNSDELARVMDPLDFAEQAFGRPLPARPPSVSPQDDPAVNPGPRARWKQRLGLPHGAPKFFLGEVEKAFANDGTFFTGIPQMNTQFVNYTLNSPAQNTQDLIRRLASYYYDMLSGHRWTFGDPETTTGAARATSVVAVQERQAFMLAVNTVAFAAPRVSNAALPGFVDLVLYADDKPNDGVPEPTYIGYGPQPIISEVIAHYTREAESNPQPLRDSISLVVELYNPNDQLVQGGADVHALNLDQFALSINNDFIPQVSDNNPQTNSAIIQLAGLPNTRLNGRCFHGVGIVNGTLDTWAHTGVPLPPEVYHKYTYPQPISSQNLVNVGDFITVKLWRRNARTNPREYRWVQVDEMKVPKPERQLPPPDPEDDDATAYSRVARDMSTETYFGNPDPTNIPNLLPGPLQARWRCIMAAEPGMTSDDPGYNRVPSLTNPGGGDGEPSARVVQNIGQPGPFASDSDGRGPTTPMNLMNANLTGAPGSAATQAISPAGLINGVYRPNSFPTVGFLMFVPRYSHTIEAAGSFKPMGTWMRDEFVLRNYTPETTTPATGRYPVDFGHMPIFDNKQPAYTYNATVPGANPNKPEPLLDEHEGKVPWGLLIWDYFSTRNVSEPNVTNFTPRYPFPYESPQKVSGRIDVNNASWFVMAGLPTIVRFNPAVTWGTASTQSMMPLAVSNSNASPAFWRWDSGLLFGQQTIANPAARPPSNLGTPRFDDMRRLEFDPLNGEVAGGISRLGGELAQAICAYRDRVPYSPGATDLPIISRGIGYADVRDDGTKVPGSSVASLRVPNGVHTDVGVRVYSVGETVRRGSDEQRQYGFMTLGEMINVYGMAGDRDAFSAAIPTDASDPIGANWPLAPDNPDFYKAVGYMAVLDTHFLTTRSNTFTMYASIMNRDPEQQEQSVRLQMTVDRSNILPQMVVSTVDYDGNGFPDIDTQQRQGTPEIIAERRVGYFNTRNDN